MIAFVLVSFQIAAGDCDYHGSTFLIAVPLWFMFVAYLMCEDRFGVTCMCDSNVFLLLVAAVCNLLKSLHQDEDGV